MTRALLALLALGAALLQVGAVPAFAFHTAAAPLLPVALLAAWGAMRRPAEVWPALLLVALALGVASEERAGWYLLALLPTGALLLALPARAPEVPARRLARAPLAAAMGSWAYLALLFVAAGEAWALPVIGLDLALGALSTAALAVVLALALWPLRARSHGLFA